MNLHEDKYIGTDVDALTSEIIFWSFKISDVGARRLFSRLPMSDYAAVRLWTKNQGDTDSTTKIYLEDIAKSLELPMHKVSRRVGKLRDRGIVRWEHDGSGEDGTYISLTDKGMRLFSEQQEILDSFCRTAVESFGEDRFKEYLSQTAELEKLISREIEQRSNETHE